MTIFTLEILSENERIFFLPDQIFFFIDSYTTLVGWLVLSSHSYNLMITLIFI